MSLWFWVDCLIYLDLIWVAWLVVCMYQVIPKWSNDANICNGFVLIFWYDLLTQVNWFRCQFDVSFGSCPIEKAISVSISMSVLSSAHLDVHVAFDPSSSFPFAYVPILSMVFGFHVCSKPAGQGIFTKLLLAPTRFWSWSASGRMPDSRPEVLSCLEWR